MRWQAKWAGSLPWLGLLVIALAALSSLGAGPPPYGDDIRLHVYRIPLVEALWAAGVPFARWLPYLNFGYGSPLFNFYPPLSAYGLTGLYWLAGQNAPLAVNALLALTLLLSAAGMFLLARHLYGTAGGLLAAALYTWSPHLVYQIYARGSVSNALALAFFPWAAWALLRLGPRPSPGRLLLAAGFIALVLLSHTAASLLFLGPLLLLVITAVTPFRFPRHELRPRLGPLLLALLLGLSLAAFSWLPALADIGYTRYTLEAGKVDFSDHFADPWRWPTQTVAGAHNPGLPKSPGWAQMLLGGMGAGLAGVMWWRQKGSERYSSRSPSLISAAQLTAVAGLISGGTLFLATAWSVPVWQAVPPLRDLQFPWRLLDIPAFCLPLAAGFLLYQPYAAYGQAPVANRPSLVKGSLRMAVYALLLLAFANLLPYLYPPRIHTLPRRPTLADVTAVQQQYGIYGLTAWGEYSTPALQTWPSGPPFPGADGNVPLAQKVLEPPPGLTAVSGTPWRATWHSRLSQPITVTLAAHHFPGWQAWLDGQPLAVGVDDNGRIQLSVPSGEHQLALAFRRTPARWLADGITAVAVMAAMGLFVHGRRQEFKPPTEKQNRLKPVGSMLDKPVAGGQVKFPLFLLVVLCLLFLVKVLVLDHVDTPLVAYPMDGRIPGANAPDAGNFHNEIRLAGYQLTPPATLTLYWQALTTPAQRYAVTVTLADATGMPRHTMINNAPGYTATTNWESGQLIRDVYQLPLDALPAPAGYSLSVSLIDTVTDEVVPLVDAPGRTAVFTGHLKNPPTPNDFPETIGALFGSAIKLRHAAVPTHLAADEPLEFTLVWESIAPVDTNYTVFVHLLSPDGILAAGQDGQPVNALYPTSWWAPGEVIIDARRWLPDLPPGTYQLEVGLYRLDTGARLSLLTSDGKSDDRVLVGDIQISE